MFLELEIEYSVPQNPEPDEDWVKDEDRGIFFVDLDNGSVSIIEDILKKNDM